MSETRILAVGDVCGKTGLQAVKSILPAYKRFAGIDFCVVNGENANGFGITPAQCEELLNYGADVVTLGNHAWGYRNIVAFAEECNYILRPANFSARSPGRGFGTYEMKNRGVCVINLIGRVGMEPNESPFAEIDRILKIPAVADCKIKLVDFHAEATSEKIAMAYYINGRVTALWGTHTHVQTNDAQIFSNGTGYITDAGMCGAYNSVIGMRPETSLSRFLGDPHLSFEASEGGGARVEGVVFTVDASAGTCISAETVRLDTNK